MKHLGKGLLATAMLMVCVWWIGAMCDYGLTKIVPRGLLFDGVLYTIIFFLGYSGYSYLDNSINKES